MNNAGFKYNAFISYSHAADNKLAPRIQSALHKFAKPWYKLRQLHIYRDQTNLSISPELWPNIQQAISQSDYFLLFASQGATQSKWVKREITWWVENRSADKLFIILTDGEVLWNDDKNDFDWSRTNALPNILSGKFKSEPNYIDFRQFKSAETFNLRDPSFLDNILSIAAPLHGKSKEELGGEDVRQHRITRIILWLTGLIIGAISIVAIWQAIVANQQRKTALEQSSISLARQLAAQSELIRSNDFKNLPLAVALATEALNIYSSTEIDHAAWESIVLLPELCNETDNQEISQARFSPDGKYFATSGQDSIARIIERSSNKTVLKIPNKGAIWDITFSNDGNMFATAGNDGTVKVIDVKTGQLITIFMHSAAVRKVLFSPDNRYLASASEDNTACIWELSQKIKRSTIRHTSKVWSLAFSHDNNYLATASRDSTAILWDVKKSEKKYSFKHDNMLWSVAFSMDDKYMLSTSDDATAKIWNTSNGRLTKTLEHSARVMAAAYSPDSNTLITTGWDKTIKIWSARDFRLLSTINTNGIIYSIAYSPDSRYFVAGGSYTSVWNTTTYKEVNRLYKEADAYNVSFSPDGEYIATADGSKGRVWKVVDNTRKEVETNDRITGEGVPIITQGWSAVMAPDNTHLLTGNEDGAARLWDLTKKNMSAFKHGLPIATVAYADTGNMLATASDSLVKVWDVKTHKLIFQYSPGKGINSLSFDHNGKYLAIGSANGITILETSSWKTFFSQPAKDPVYYIAFSGSAQSLVLIDAGNRLSLLNMEKKTSFFTREYPNLRSVNLSPDKNHICLIAEDKIFRLNFDNSATDEVTIPVSNGLDIAGSPDNKSLAVSSSNDSTITLYDIRTGKRTTSFRHNSAVNAASFDKTGRYLATACQDGTIHIRDLQTKTEVSFITWNSNDPVEKVAFSSDGKYIIAASQKYKTSAWLWRASDAISLACRLLNYRLTEADWNLYMNGRKYQPVCR
ncbi:WD40 domain-containing protein [Chitinophaga tropicalis]|uniref:WD40 domain-containing protein n=1 Tax=Chitinophaga tropicalis TaxID=2683588 RepID=UPI0018DFC6EC|nr:TIR domain-containing protein [Chitinophaga tropicalis]